MNGRRRYIIFVLIFAIGCVVAFLFENSYFIFVRSLYTYFSNGKLRFIENGEFYFPTYSFVFSFGLFCSLVASKIRRPLNVIVLIRLIASVFAFCMAIVEFSNIESVGVLMMCDLCNGGPMRFDYRDISIDNIFIIALVFAYLPFILFNKYTIKSQKEYS
ncbi:hypothetical protein BDD43_0344 [Mucilaginibacter gracilis]|uniref:Uncharacterized protein n=1 Tax=Mucilaginibacter gracilis TaxID=423350 RepID=A0A495IW67_9SPHI|nr:hypothetical protein [Mucilaginibacter gracilis]RKR80248.1 hypothetical protein BDD43_0344 [Mucilaginibacter gracilis]